MKVLFSGGGTLGPVTPLLAIREMIMEGYPDVTCVWIGTRSGPERALVEQSKIPFFSIPSGKLRRYASFDNFSDIFRVIIGFFQSIKILWKENPDLCISAGGFISVPVHVAAWVLGIPTWVHEQDVRVGLATKIMAPFAKVVTTALEKNTKAFSAKKVRWLGNPIRAGLLLGSGEAGRQKFHLDSTLPVVFATGGGTGSAKVNVMVADAAQHLSGICQILHVTGKNDDREGERAKKAASLFPSYHVYEFFSDEMKDAYAVADVIISRGGFGTITEIAALRKPAILIPKPGHQEANVSFLSAAGAVIVLDEQATTGYHLAGVIKELLADKEKRRILGERLGNLLPAAHSVDVHSVICSIIP